MYSWIAGIGVATWGQQAPFVPPSDTRQSIEKSEAVPPRGAQHLRPLPILASESKLPRMRAWAGVLAVSLVVGCSSSSSTPASGGDGGGGGSSGSSGGGSSGGPGGSSSGAAGGSSSSGAGSSGSSSGGGSSGGSGAGDGGSLVTYGQPYQSGQYNLGVVDYAETQWHNACAPSTKYNPTVQASEGTLLAGLWDGIQLFGGVPSVAGFCDACIWVTTPTGHSGMLRVVTFGQTSTNSIDTSQSAYNLLNTGEYPRAMTWQFARCPDTGAMMYEFQTGSNAYWTSLWVRNARVPLAKVEVQSPNHAAWTALTRGTDGTLTDGSGFGTGSFSIRSTGVDGQQVTDTFAWPGNGIAGAFLTGKGNFQ
jgi:expansin (peptidoglycan-binding protein)